MTPPKEGPLSALTLQEATQTPSLAGGGEEFEPHFAAVNGDDRSGLDWAAAASRSRAQRGPADASALPCQNSNNSDKPAKRYRLKRVPNAEGWFTSKDCKNAIWEQVDGDTIRRWGQPSGAEAKSAFHLRLNVASFVEHWGRNHCLFSTVTDEADLHPTQFARRWNHYLRRHGHWIVSFIRVLEPQKQGRPHYHLLVAVPWDTRPDEFDWEAFDGCQQERRANGPTPRFRELRARYKPQPRPSWSRCGDCFEKCFRVTGSDGRNCCRCERERKPFPNMSANISKQDWSSENTRGKDAEGSNLIGEPRRRGWPARGFLRGIHRERSHGVPVLGSWGQHSVSGIWTGFGSVSAGDGHINSGIQLRSPTRKLGMRFLVLSRKQTH